MPKIVSYEDIPNPRVPFTTKDGDHIFQSMFFESDDVPDSPMAFLAEHSPGRYIRPHFHFNDQFQVIMSGGGHLGHHELGFPGVHFARAYTPYGPIKADERGISFLTLRAHQDPGAQYLPESRPILEKVSDRKPWQTTGRADLSLDVPANGVAVQAMPGLSDEHGLACFSVVMKPGTQARMPDPAGSAGQYIIITKGSVSHQGKTTKGLTLIWVEKDEPPVQLVAGTDGCEAMVLNYPVVSRRATEKSPTHRAGGDAGGNFEAHQCVLCGFVYDEAEGMPEAGIAAGTRWADVPEDFGCPDCAAKKADFQPLEL